MASKTFGGICKILPINKQIFSRTKKILHKMFPSTQRPKPRAGTHRLLVANLQRQTWLLPISEQRRTGLSRHRIEEVIRIWLQREKSAKTKSNEQQNKNELLLGTAEWKKRENMGTSLISLFLSI